jgi:hypothetical protein
MSDPNRADISVFEGIQQQANNAMGCSSQAVFNDAQTVCNSRWTNHIVRETKNIDKLYQNYAKVGITIEEIAGDLQQRQSAVLRGALERSINTQKNYRKSMRVAANNVVGLIQMEREQLKFNYQPGATVPKDGVSPDAYKERKAFADAVNAFYTGSTPDGTPYVMYLD